ncbi:uncharacterized protein LOC111406862 [Olea europaea var. sylvestris]|uniref:uncharacterized protein LOC111406862 n=1 Tax=Olea europaea var. sylvestris TaxID=158386 RepID=UPI000C1D8228|nr:uncharacterized protein LOC111406862 [Olea europaea var. sylvestris]
MGDKDNRGMGSTPTKAIVEGTDPYSLHHSDHPGMVLVSKVLEEDNYGTWSRAMRISLSAKNKIGFITGSIKPPSSTDDSFPSWQRCNDMIRTARQLKGRGCPHTALTVMEIIIALKGAFTYMAFQ